MNDCPYCQNSFEMTETCSDEFRMWQGLQGPYYIPSVDENGILSWTNTGELPNPDSVDITGPAGASFSIAGIVETVGDLPSEAEGVWLVGEEAPYEGYSYVDGAWADIGQFSIGPQGPAGEDGANGQAAGFGTPTATIDNNTGTPSVTVTASGPDTAKVFAFAFTNLKGATGATGQTGPAGQGIASGGTTGQVLAKKSNTDYDTEWVNQSGGGGSGTVESVNSVQPDANGNVLITADDIGTDANGISVQDAIDDTVHVGTSAPTDPTCKIWLDTDEPGMSAVSSVNGHTGTVVLDYADVGALSKMTLLWTNASPGSSFAAQTIQIDLSGYDAVLIQCNFDNNNADGKDDIILVGFSAYIGTIVHGNSYSRKASVSSSGITFETGYYNTGSNAVANIPVKVYGIKGVVSA